MSGGGKPLWVRWFPSDMRGSARVSMMTRDEEYLYRVLLDVQAIQGFVVPDARRMAHACKMTPGEFEALWKEIQDCFEEVEPGQFANQRMAEERGRTERARDAARANGSRGGRPQKKPSAKPDGNRPVSAGFSEQEPKGKADRKLAESREPEAERESQSQSESQSGERPSAAARGRARTPRWSLAKDAPSLLDHEAPEVVAAWNIWVRHQIELPAGKRATRSKIETHARKVREVIASPRGGASAAVALLDEAVSGGWAGLPPQVVNEYVDGTRERSGRAMGPRRLPTRDEASLERSERELREWLRESGS